MSVVRDAFIAEVDSLIALGTSLKSALEQIESFDIDGEGPLVVECPAVAEAIARMAAGCAKETESARALILAIDADLNHDVALVLGHQADPVHLRRREVHQPLHFAQGVPRSDVADAIRRGLEYVSEKAQCLRQRI